MVFKVLEKRGLNMRDKATLYKAVVQTVMLYGRKFWVTMDSMMKVFGGVSPSYL